MVRISKYSLGANTGRENPTARRSVASARTASDTQALARFAVLLVSLLARPVCPSSRQLHAVVCHQVVQLMLTCLTNGPPWTGASLGLLAVCDTHRSGRNCLRIENK